MRFVADVKEKPTPASARADNRGRVPAPSGDKDGRAVGRNANATTPRTLGEITAAIVERLSRERRER